MNDVQTTLMNLQLQALGQIRTQLRTNTDRLIRLENKLEQISRAVDRLARKESNE